MIETPGPNLTCRYMLPGNIYTRLRQLTLVASSRERVFIYVVHISYGFPLALDLPVKVQGKVTLARPSCI